MGERTHPEGFAPGEYIRDEMEERRLTQLELAKILGRPPQFVSELLSGKRSITPETAVGLASAFETSPMLWLKLESAYQLSRMNARTDLAVAKRAQIYGIVPVKELVDRRWIEDSTNASILEDRIKKLYETESIEALREPVPFGYAARQATDPELALSPAQRAWYCRSRHLARKLDIAGVFSDESFATAVAHLAHLRSEVEELRRVPRILSEAGIRFLIVQHLSRTRIDGGCFWLDDQSPVIVLSLRFDRVDWFWHTLMHEMRHVKNRDGKDPSSPTLDMDLVGPGAEPSDHKSEIEKEANRWAANFLVDQQTLDGFIRRVRPYYSALKITHFAEQLNVHPGIVVGQLQYRQEIPYSHSRRMLVGVKQVITAAALTDGWGWVPHF